MLVTGNVKILNGNKNLFYNVYNLFVLNYIEIGFFLINEDFLKINKKRGRKIEF